MSPLKPKNTLKPKNYALSIRWGNQTHNFLHFYNTVSELLIDANDKEMLFAEAWKAQGGKTRKPILYKWQLLP